MHDFYWDCLPSNCIDLSVYVKLFWAMYGPCNIAVSAFVLIRWTQFVSLFLFKLMMMICQARLIKKFHFSQFLNKSQNFVHLWKLRSGSNLINIRNNDQPFSKNEKHIFIATISSIYLCSCCFVVQSKHWKLACVLKSKWMVWLIFWQQRSRYHGGGGWWGCCMGAWPLYLGHHDVVR